MGTDVLDRHGGSNLEKRLEEGGGKKGKAKEGTNIQKKP